MAIFRRTKSSEQCPRGRWHGAIFFRILLNGLLLSIPRAIWRRNRDEGGFALLVVLVVMVALSLMIGAAVSATESLTRQTIAHLAALRLSAALDGAVETVGRDLSEAALRGVPLDTSSTVNIGEVAVRVSIRPEIAKIDIGMGNPQVIEQLLRISGVSQSFSHRIADEIAAWQGKGGEGRYMAVGNYNTAGRSPHSFETLSDLALLPDGNDDLVTCLEPDITLYTHSRDIDLSTASQRLRQAVNAVTPNAQTRANPIAAAGVLGSAYGRPDLYEITETATDEVSHLTVTRQSVLRLTGDPHDPFWILAVTSPGPSAEEARSACERLRTADKD